MQPTLLRNNYYATQLLHNYATQLLHNYATHTQKLENFFYTLEEQGTMKVMLSNLYDASMVAPVELEGVPISIFGGFGPKTIDFR